MEHKIVYTNVNITPDKVNDSKKTKQRSVSWLDV